MPTQSMHIIWLGNFYCFLLSILTNDSLTVSFEFKTVKIKIPKCYVVLSLHWARQVNPSVLDSGVCSLFYSDHGNVHYVIGVLDSGCH